MDQKEFIELVVMNQVGDIVKLHPYLSFPLMCTCIELLGTCIDTRPLAFDQIGQSGERFRSAILQLFPTNYHRFADRSTNIDLYTELRCGMLHQFLPKSKVKLGEAKHSYNMPSILGPVLQLGHLSVYQGSVLLLAEILYKDLQDASVKVLEKLNSGEINGRFQLRVS